MKKVSDHQEECSQTEPELSKYQEECLIILQEECGETIQEICKIFRFGLHNESWHIQGSTHLKCLEQEIGDILKVVDLVIDSNIGVTREGIELAKLAKMQKLKKWMKYNKDSRSGQL